MASNIYNWAFGAANPPRITPGEGSGEVESLDMESWQIVEQPSFSQNVETIDRMTTEILTTQNQDDKNRLSRDLAIDIDPVIHAISNGKAMQCVQQLKADNFPGLLSFVVMLNRGFQQIPEGVLVERNASIIKGFLRTLALQTKITPAHPLYVLSELSLDLESIDPLKQSLNDRWLAVNGNGTLQIAKPNVVSDHIQVAEACYKVVSSMKEHVNQLDTPSLLNLNYLALNFLANYAKLLGDGQEGCAPICSYLSQMATILRNEINRRKQSGEQIALSPQQQQLIAQVSEALESVGYANMFQSKEMLKKLEQLNQVMPLIQTVLSQSANQLTTKGLTFVAADEELGVRLYKNGGQLVAIFEGGDTLLAQNNPWQSLPAVFGLPGSAYESVVSCAEKRLKGLTSLLTLHKKRLVGKNKILLFGFGVDGSAAELVAYKMAKEDPLRQYDAVGAGCPDYLGFDAMAKVRDLKNPDMNPHKNFQSSALQFVHDTINRRSEMVAGALGSNSIHPAWTLALPLYTSAFSFFQEMLGGHFEEIYACNIEDALSIAQSVYEGFYTLTQDIQNLPMMVANAPQIERPKTSGPTVEEV